MKRSCREGDEFGEPAIASEDSGFCPVRTAVVVSRAAAPACPAPYAALSNHMIPDVETFDIGAKLHDFSGPFVPRCNRVGGKTLREICHRAVKDLHVSPANPGGTDPYEHFIRVWRRTWPILYGELTRTNYADRLQIVLPLLPLNFSESRP